MSLEDPIGAFRQMPSHGSHGNGMAFASGDPVVDLAHVFGVPGWVMPMAHHHVGSFDAPTLRSGVLRERPT